MCSSSCVINALITFLFSPEQGVEIYGTRHVIVKLFGTLYTHPGAIVLPDHQVLQVCLGDSAGDHLPADHQSERIRLFPQRGGRALQGSFCVFTDPALFPGYAARLSRHQPGTAGSRTGNGGQSKYPRAAFQKLADDRHSAHFFDTGPD